MRLNREEATRLAPTALSPIEPAMDSSPSARLKVAALRDWYLALAVHEEDQRTPCDPKSASASNFDSHTNGNMTVFVFHHSLTGECGVVLREDTRAARSIRGRVIERKVIPEVMAGDRPSGAWGSDDEDLAWKGE